VAFEGKELVIEQILVASGLKLVELEVMEFPPGLMGLEAEQKLVVLGEMGLRPVLKLAAFALMELEVVLTLVAPEVMGLEAGQKPGVLGEMGLEVGQKLVGVVHQVSQQMDVHWRDRLDLHRDRLQVQY
jgi:hypothetical protein